MRHHEKVAKCAELSAKISHLEATTGGSSAEVKEIVSALKLLASIVQPTAGGGPGEEQPPGGG